MLKAGEMGHERHMITRLEEIDDGAGDRSDKGQ